MSGICDGRVAIVTGSGRGIGRCHALELACQGAKVVVNDVGGAVDGSASGETPADEVVAEIVAAGGEAIANRDDVADWAGAEQLVRCAIDHFGGLDVLVNNAGILRDRTIVKMTEDEWDAVIRVHLKGTFAPTHFAAAYWKERSAAGEPADARLINTTSASGLFGAIGQANYGAAKMGLVGLVNVLKLEGAKYGITVNAIAPVAGTRMTEDLLGPMVEKLDPQLVSPAVAYLASEACELTGEVWSVAGGSVSRFFVGLTQGYFKHPDSGALTIEDVAEHVDDIRREEGYLVPRSNQEELQTLAPKLFS